MQNEYQTTSDLGLAASLYTSGFRVERVDKSNPRRVVFCFKETDELNLCIAQYWAGDLMFPADSIIVSIKYLKSLIYA
jgi:hypothetical protein